MNAGNRRPRPSTGWIRRGYLDALYGVPYENAPGPERYPVDTDPASLPESWSMYLAGLHLGTPLPEAPAGEEEAA